jgi:16S rRNA G966 N2-methylase RsmD
MAERLEVRCEPVERALPRLAGGGFHLVFLDPPYGVGPGAALEALLPLLAPQATVVAEHDAGAPPPDDPPGLTLDTRRVWGGTGISIYRRR